MPQPATPSASAFDSPALMHLKILLPFQVFDEKSGVSRVVA